MTQQLLWYRFLADSDMSHDPSAEPTVHAFMPLKLLVDRTRFAAQHPQISGYVTSMRAVPTTQQNFLAVQVMLSLSPSLVNAMKAGKQQEELGRITILPEPRLEFGSSVDCEIIYDPLLSGMEEQVEQIRVSCTSYRAGEFVVENHRPRFEAYTHAIELRLPANSAQPTLLFVVDAQVTFLNNHSVLSAQQTYQLSASGGASYVAAECVKIDEDDEQELVLADDKDEDAAPAHDRSRSRQATAGPGFFSLFPGEIKENTVKAYHSLVDIYFEVPPGESLEGKEDLLRPWLLQDVVVSILERCEVAGRKGFFADVRRDSASDSNRPADFPFSSAFSSASEHVPGSAAVEGPRTFGSLDIYCDGEGTAGCRTLTQSIPKDVSLFSFMLFPRMLFSCHSRHHKNIIPESQHRKYRGMVHLDYSFMRLHFPRLPNVFLTDIERLPLSLRPCHLDEVMKFVKVGDVKLVANVRALAGVFAALIGTFPRMVSLPEELNEVQDNFSMTVSRFTCSGFLLRHASSGVLVYRSKDSQPTEATTNDDATFSSIPAPFAARLGSAFAHAFFTDGDSTTQQPSNTVPLFQHYVSDDYTYRPMAQQGIGRRNMDLPTPVYHPFPGLAIVGEPTVSRHEELPEPHEAHFLMQFTPFRVAKRTSSLYKISSLGRVSRDIIFSHRIQRCKTGRILLDYVMCLMHATQRFGLPDGTFYIYGNMLEPLFLLYAARRTMRYLVNLHWNLFAFDPSSPKQRTVEEEDGEEKHMIEVVNQTTIAIMEDIAQHVALPCYITTESFLSEKRLVMKAYDMTEPQTVQDNDDGPAMAPPPTTRKKDTEEEQLTKVFGRLPVYQVSLTFEGGASLFSWKGATP